MKRFLLLFLLLPVLYPQAQIASCETPGTSTRETYSSRAVGQTMYYTVYTPPCYDDSGSAYPVIYLLHGSNDDDNHWIRLGFTDLLDEKIMSGEIPPVVAVFPFGNVIANRNRFDNFSWRESFLNELMPDVESRYNISTDSDYRAIGGVSRGGFWAYQIAFSNPGMFSAAAGHSAFFDLYHAEPQDNPLDLALNEQGIDSMRLWLDRGINDFAFQGLDIMADHLRQRGVEFSYTIHPQGEHNNDYWSSHIEEYLNFYVSDWLQPSIEPAPAPLSIFATNTPTAAQSTPVPQSNSDLLLPVVAFASLQTSITLSEIQAIANGLPDERLILTPEIAGRINPHPDTRIMESNTLRHQLWQSRTSYSLLPLSEITLDYRILLLDDMPVIDQLDDYPFAGNTDTLTRFTLSGVTALTRETRTALNENGLEWATSGIRDYVTSGDIFHMSNEVSFATACPQLTSNTLGGASSFCSLEEHFELFNLLEVDLVELTGNHNNDYNYEAYRNTLAWYQENGIATVGGGETLESAREPYIIEHNGNSIAVLACNEPGPYYALASADESSPGGIRPGATPCDLNWLETAIPELSNRVDVLIISVQYEEVEDYLPLDSQRIDFRRLASLGADVVIGSQAHKPQTFEFYPSGDGEIAFIHYGTGNLFFDQPFWGNMRFFMDTLYIADGELRGIELFPGIIDDLARPRLMTTDERENFMFFILTEQNGL